MILAFHRKTLDKSQGLFHIDRVMFTVNFQNNEESWHGEIKPIIRVFPFDFKVFSRFNSAVPGLPIF